ncbi:MAG: folate family ECF transporter S component [Clostridia bacterium]|nr:folate family ECF transporter S component [Clostridia bacterium]
MQKNSKQFLFKVVFTSVLIALNVILERFLSYSVWNQSISFSFITIAFAASFLGIPYAIAVGGLGDLIGSLLFPFGPYFPGFTLTNVLAALCTGIFLRKNATILKISASVVLNKIFCTLLLNTLWISILYRGGISDFYTVLVPRLPQAVFMGIIEIIVLIIVFSEKSKIRNILAKNINKIN